MDRLVVGNRYSTDLSPGLVKVKPENLSPEMRKELQDSAIQSPLGTLGRVNGVHGLVDEGIESNRPCWVMDLVRCNLGGCYRGCASPLWGVWAG